MPQIATIEDLGVLKLFGYPTKIEECKPSTHKDISIVMKLKLSDADFKAGYMGHMETYPQLFTDKKASCQECHEPIILPIDLRRNAGANYHGQCFREHMEKELRDYRRAGSKDSWPTLEYFLRVIRTCSPNFPNQEERPLTRGLLHMEGITDRASLEKFYWNS